jgi:flagellar biosynthesis protein FlhF
MKIKTYVVDKLPEVYPLIFQDLGDDAFILKRKRIKSGGVFGLFCKRQIEVVAAADLSGGKKQGISGSQQQGEWNTETNGLQPISTQASEAPLFKLDPQHEVLKELSEMKGLIRSMVQGELNAESIPRSLEKWIQRLQDQEVDEEVIQYVIKKANMSPENIGTLSDQEVEQKLLTILEQLFDEGITKETNSTTSFITVVGPTGVGKTTTIAKLAAARVFQQRQRVGLLTTDTFRIGAVEQLRTYANILNIPLEVVKNADDLKTAMTSLKGCNTVFMDSAGRNYLEDEYIEEINQYLRYDVPQENYLVLSMTTRWRDMRKIVEQMKTVPIDKLILTKWDETTCYGVALNMLYHYPYPLSYLSLGQGVPQDIMMANSKFMAKKLLGVDEFATRPSTSPKTII